MVYLVQGDEFRMGGKMFQRLAEVLAESEELTIADATYRLRSSYGILRFESREEAERVATRFTDMGFANFLLDELLRVPRANLLGRGLPAPAAKIGLAVLAKLETQTRRKVLTGAGRGPRIASIGTPVSLPAAEEAEVTEHRTRYVLDMLTQSEHWRAQSGTLPRIVEVFLQLDVSEAHLSEGVRSLSRSDRRIPTFREERAYDKYVMWLFHLKYG